MGHLITFFPARGSFVPFEAELDSGLTVGDVLAIELRSSLYTDSDYDGVLVLVESTAFKNNGPRTIIGGTMRLLELYKGEQLIPIQVIPRIEYFKAEVVNLPTAVLSKYYNDVVPVKDSQKHKFSPGLDVGTLLSDEAVNVRFNATGFMRHTAFLAQSGSGKSYALGVLLEEFITKTSARLIVLDPNGDFSKIWTAADECPDQKWFDQEFSPHKNRFAVVSTPDQTLYKKTAAKVYSADLRGAIFVLDQLPPQVWPNVANEILTTIWEERSSKQATIIVLDEAHNFAPQNPTDQTRRLAEVLITIAGEGRKYGLWLVLATQRPQKLHENVLSQCDNLIVMKLTSRSDISHIVSSYNAVSQEMVESAKNFNLGEALAVGRIAKSPTLFKFRRRYTAEGGDDLSKDWAKPEPKKG